MASRIDYSQNRKLYVGTTAEVTVADGNAIIAGNVGIGATGPLTKLHVFEAGTAMIRVDSGATSPYKAGIEFLRSSINGGRIYNDGGAVQIKLESDFAYDAANPTRGGFMFKTAPVTSGTLVDAVRIDARGNVGIGTTSPGAELDVAAITNAVIRLTSTGNGLGANTALGSLQFYGNDASVPGAGIKSSIVAKTEAALGDDSNLIFSTSDGTTNNVERMRITSAGNVGIGTTGPLAKLDVQGTQGQLFSVTDDLSGSIFAVADISGVPIFDVNSSGVSTFDGDVDIKTSFGGSNFYQLGVGTTSSGSIYTEGRIFCGGTSFTVGEAIFNDKVGIGTTSPSAKLDVKETTSDVAGEIIVGGLIASDDVPFGKISFANTAAANTQTNDVLASIAGEKVGSSNRGELTFLTSDNAAPVERMRIASDGAIQFNDYGAGTLVTDANGNISAATSGLGTAAIEISGGLPVYNAGITRAEMFDLLLLPEITAGYNVRSIGGSTGLQITSGSIYENGAGLSIGDTSPISGVKLKVVGDGTSDNTPQLIIASGGADNNSILEFSDDAGGQVSQIGTYEGNELTFAAQNTLVFKTNSSTIIGSSDVRMVIETNGALELNNYTSTSYKSGVTPINPIQSFYPSNGVGSDTTTDLAVDQQGNVVRTTQEATWKLTRAQVDNITTSTTGTTLLSAPGSSNLFIIIEKVTFLIQFVYNGNQMLTSQQYQIIQDGNIADEIAVINGTRINDIAYSGYNINTSGIYEHDTGYSTLNRTYKPNTATTIRRVNGGALNTAVSTMSIKIRYRVYDKTTF